ncbi:MAG: phage holin family protein [Patescibacteria group bacterium]
MKILIRFIINVAVLLLIARLFDDIQVVSVYVATITALLLALVNALIRPILIVLTLPINIITLGLFVLVINALLFWFVASFVDGFDVSGFSAAFIGALIMSLFSWLSNAMLREAK